MTTEMVKLISMEGDVVECPRSAAATSKMLSNALHLEDEDDTYDTVPVKRCKADVLQKVVDFMVANEEEPMATIPDPTPGSIPKEYESIVPAQRYRDFVDELATDMSLFYGVRSAANFMEIEQLYYLTCLWLVFQMKGKTAEEIRVMLRIPKLTLEEESEAREKHPWLFEITTPLPDDDDNAAAAANVVDPDEE